MYSFVQALLDQLSRLKTIYARQRRHTISHYKSHKPLRRDSHQNRVIWTTE